MSLLLLEVLDRDRIDEAGEGKNKYKIALVTDKKTKEKFNKDLDDIVGSYKKRYKTALIELPMGKSKPTMTPVKKNPGDEEYQWTVMIVCDNKVRDEFEEALDRLFQSYVPKTRDGYIEVL